MFPLYQDSHHAFLRDDPSLLQNMTRTRQRIPKARGIEISTTGLSHCTVSSPMIDAIMDCSATTFETNYESNTSLELIDMDRQQTHSSTFTILPSTGGLGSLLADAAKSPRSINHSDTRLDVIPIQPYPVHPFSLATLPNTRQFDALGSESDMTTRPAVRQSNTPPSKSIRGKWHRGLQIQFSNSSHFGSLKSEALTAQSTSISPQLLRSDTGNRMTLSLPALEPSQLNQHSDEDLSIETIEDINAISQPDDP